MSDLPSAVLFCCTMNAIRSPMAEALLKYLKGTQIYVDSCGVRAGETDGFAIAVMDELGLEIEKHQSKTFHDLEDDSFDLIISLSPQAQHSAVEMTRHMACEVEFWNTLDPSIIEGGREERLEVYRRVRDQLMQRIQERF
jgi:protein-tyrosine-phosphatase